MILVTENIAGNLHQAASTINQRELADYVIAMHRSGNYTIVVYRMTIDEKLNFQDKKVLW